MSTDFIIHRRGAQQVVIVERSSLFDLDLIDYDNEEPYDYSEGPQKMSARETLDMAAGIIYAVSCMYPEEAETLIAQMNIAGIPATWNRIQRSRGES